jgi:PKD repeat protein
MAKVDTVFGIARKSAFFKAVSTLAFCITIICLFATSEAFAKDYSFTWSANSEPVEGYKLYYKKGGDPVAPFDGTGAIQGPSPITIGKQTTFTITGLEDNTTYYFALTAYNGTEESGYSDIVAVNATGTASPSTSGLLAAVITTTSRTGEAPFNLTFDGSQSTGSISSYTWSFGDDGTATGPIVSYTYQFAGTYMATLTVTDGSGLTQQSSIAITVTDPLVSSTGSDAPPTAIISSSTALGAVPLTVNFDGSRSTAADNATITSYLWSFGDGSSATGTGVAHSFVSAGTYQTSLTVTDSNGLTSSISTTVMVTATRIDNKAPAAVISATPVSGTTPLTVTFDGSNSTDSDGSIASYSWNFGDGKSASGKTVTHTYTSEVAFIATLQVTDNLGADDAVNTRITVQPKGLKTANLKLNIPMPWLLLLLSEAGAGHQ